MSRTTNDKGAYTVSGGDGNEDSAPSGARQYTTDDICLGAVPAMQGTENWRQIGQIISDISERLYCAGWMQHAEYDVYRLMTEGGHWGMGCASDVAEYLGALQSLSRLYDVWVTWCSEHGEEPTRLSDWKPVYDQWRTERHHRNIGADHPDPHRYDDGDDARAGDLCVWCLAPMPEKTRALRALTQVSDQEATAPNREERPS